MALVMIMIVNFVSSVWLVILNKQVYLNGFPYVTALGAIHFAVTSIGAELLFLSGIFPRKKLAQLAVFPISLAFIGFVIFNNLSLKYNGVVQYQLLKVLTTPCHMLYDRFWLKIHLPKIQIFLLIIVNIGVALSCYKPDSISQDNTTIFGLLIGLVGVLCATSYQILVKLYQQKLDCTSQQLLAYQTPQAALLVFFTSPIIDKITFQKILDIPLQGWMLAFGSGILAFTVNYSIYLMISKTSPLSYNILGHAKLATILFFGAIVFKEEISSLNMVGITSVLVSVSIYTYLKNVPQENKIKSN